MEDSKRYYVVMKITSQVMGTTEQMTKEYREYLDAEASGDNIGWSCVSAPDVKYEKVPWRKDMPVVVGIYDYDPTPLFEQELRWGHVNIQYFEPSDIQTLIQSNPSNKEG